MNMLTDIFEFKWKFAVSCIKNRLRISQGKRPADRVVFVTHEGTKEWILGALARRLSRAMRTPAKVLYSPNSFARIPAAKGYFFLHQNYFAKALKRNHYLFTNNSKSIVLFTHPNFTKVFSRRHIAYVLSRAHRIVCLNSAVQPLLERMGIPREKVLVWPMAADPNVFFPAKKSNGKTVGMSMAYYERKNPQLMYDIVCNMPEVDFTLIGKGWKSYPKFKQLRAKPNFTYFDEVAYEQYPALYHTMDVFLSTSTLEGGPVPLLETMLCNIIPVVSRTGFGPDIVTHEKNGYLFEIDADCRTVINLIRKALKNKSKPRDDVITFSWQQYGQKLDELFAAVP